MTSTTGTAPGPGTSGDGAGGTGGTSDAGVAGHRGGADRADYLRYLVGSGASLFGTIFTAVATAVLAVDVFGVGGLQAGVLAAAATAPTLLVAPAAGALADRVRRPRRLLVGTELAEAAIVSVLLVGVATSTARYPWLVAVDLSLGVTGTVSGAIFFTHLNSLRPGRLAASRAQLQTTTYLVTTAAGAIAGPVVSTFGPVVALTVDVASYVVGAACLLAIRARDHNPALDEPGPAAGAPTGPGTTGPANGRRPRRERFVGLRVLLAGRMGPVVGYALVAQTAFAGIVGLKALFLLRTLQIPLAAYGLPAIGAAVLGASGSVLATRMVSAGRPAARLAAAWWAGATSCLLLLPLASGPPAAAIALATVALGGTTLCGAAANVAVVALFSEAVPEQVMGRVNAVMMVLVTGAGTVGSVLAGELADRIGVRGALWVCAVAGLAALPMLRPLWRDRGLRR